MCRLLDHEGGGNRCAKGKEHLILGAFMCIIMGKI